jgi:hypothetical protein
MIEYGIKRRFVLASCTNLRNLDLNGTCHFVNSIHCKSLSKVDTVKAYLDNIGAIQSRNWRIEVNIHDAMNPVSGEEQWTTVC